MKIELSNVGHRFGSNWIFKNINQQLSADHQYAILGPNGSGKSTLLKIIGGALSPAKGSVSFSNSTVIEKENIFRSIAIAAPYAEILEELTIPEFLTFYQKFKPFKSDFSIDSFLKEYNFVHSKNKFIQQFSSGMKQRLKLGVALDTKCDVLLLDEPFSNLDENTIELFTQKIEQDLNDRLLIIASNNKEEFKLCNKFIELA